jgi:hypothetical protein
VPLCLKAETEPASKTSRFFKKLHDEQSKKEEEEDSVSQL